ncbi:HAD-IIIA family hydrolase [Kitasatospora sp. NPDC004240]
MAYLIEALPTVPLTRPTGDRPAGGGGPWLSGHPALAAAGAGASGGTDAAGPVGAVLFGRDGTLIQDVAYNGDPGLVHPLAGVRAALAALRAHGVALGVVSNQPGVARGVIGREQVETVQARTEELLGPFAVWAVCPHGPHEHCDCRMPAPRLVLEAARLLGLPPARVAVVAGTDPVLEAALTAGAHAVRVPDPYGPYDDPRTPCALAPCPLVAGPEQAARLVLGGGGRT